MERAGSAVARVVSERFPHARRVVVLCGKGNNGGDGFVAARALGAEALLLARRDDVAGDARAPPPRSASATAWRVREVADAAGWNAARATVDEADLLVDALLGTGLRRGRPGCIAGAIDALVERAGRGVPVVAVDLPSGLSSDGGQVDWPRSGHPDGDLRRAEARPRAAPGLRARGRAGGRRHRDLGADPGRREALLVPAGGRGRRAAFPRRARSAHKGHFGHVLIVAGSVGKTGAAVLAAGGALRAGAGLVTVATPQPCLPIVAAARAEVMTEPLPATAAEGSPRKASSACWPWPPSAMPSSSAPASARTLRPARWSGPSCARARCRSSWTRTDSTRSRPAPPPRARLDAIRRDAAHDPHAAPGRDERGSSAGQYAEIQAPRPETAASLARSTGAVVVLKGERTLVAEAGRAGGREPDRQPGHGHRGHRGRPRRRRGRAAGAARRLARRDGRRSSCTGAPETSPRGALGEEGLVAGDLVEALPEAISRCARAGGGRIRD